MHHLGVLQEKRRILDFVFSNSSWKDSRLILNYRKPFDILALTNAGMQKKRAAPPKKHGPFENWLPGRDSLRLRSG
jgi:hypothetical protein